MNNTTDNSYSNSSYIFIPFQYNIQQDYDDLMINVYDKMSESGQWEYVEEKINYMLRFVTDKIVNEKKEDCQCYHFKLKDSEDTSLSRKLGWAAGKEKQWLCLDDVFKYDGQEIRYYFQILNVELFLFRTGVGFLAYQVHVKDKGEDGKTFDVYALSAALYRMKKVNQNYFLNVKGQEIISSFQEIAKELLLVLIPEKTLSSSLFFYANNGKNMNQRSYIMSIMYQSGELEDRDQLFGNELRRQMYFYRNCYHDGFIYVPNTEEENDEMLCLTREIIWGVSSEAMVALAFPDMVDDSGKKFLKGRFFDNFNSNYLFMYVFLLHQKIALYQFLCKISEHQKMSLEALEEYGKELYQFETDFEYSRITDVPQYQKLYEMLKKSLGIPQLFHDVVEPLEDLREEKERIKEKQQAEQERQLNITLGILGFLAIFSALVDSFDFSKSFFEKLGWSPVIIFKIQIGCITIIVMSFLVALVLIFNLWKNKGKYLNKQNQESYKKKRSD